MKAKYTKSNVAAYKGNPLIEALPPLLSSKEVGRALRHEVPYDEEERQLPTHEREHCLISVLQFFEPLPHHIDLEAKLSRTLRFGYVGRNPLAKGFWQDIPKTAEEVAGNLEDEERPIPSLKKINTGFSLIGVSGTGKSTGVERILEGYPQVIRHTEYQGKKMEMTQVPWLKLDCPFDSSVKGLCLKFFAGMDEILGSNYFDLAQRRKGTVDQLMPHMARVGKIHGLGVLIIDEIQHLAAKRKYTMSQSRMLNFFVELINTAGLPIILIGTPKAVSVLTNEFRSARRSAGQGDILWNRMEK